MEKHEFLFAGNGIPGNTDICDIAQAENLNRFATRVSYLNASVCGGKLSPEKALKEVKSLYKEWKNEHKLIESKFNWWKTLKSLMMDVLK